MRRGENYPQVVFLISNILTKLFYEVDEGLSVSIILYRRRAEKRSFRSILGFFSALATSRFHIFLRRRKLKA